MMSVANKMPLLSRFTPSVVAAQTLEAIFVQRQKLAADLVERIQDSALTASKHYSLLIGARGMGKTHLVSLVYHRVRALPALQEHLLIAWLQEEEWGIDSFLELLLRILRALAIEDTSIEPRIEPLFQLPPDQAESVGIQILKEIIGQRTLLLLIENLDDLFAGLGEKGQQKLRSFLQESACCTILATAVGLFNGVKRRTAPFYGFFRPVYLQELTVQEAQELLIKIATLQGQADLVAFLKTPTGQARVQAVQHLAGGNPRIYITFAEFLTCQLLDELVPPFIGTMDMLTPYYQSRMRFLSLQQRKIVEFLCEHKFPVPVKEIAQRCFISHQTASSQLKDLLEKGYVRKDAIGRESFYELREPLMRICLGMKKYRSEPIGLIVDFLRTWYPKNELQAMQQNLLTTLGPTSSMHSYLDHALDDAEITDEDPRIQACWEQIQAQSDQEEYDAALNIAEKLLKIRDSWVERALYAACLCFSGHYEEAISSYDQVLEIKPDFHKAWNNRGIALASLGRYEEAISSYDQALKLKPDFPLALEGGKQAILALSSWEKNHADLEQLLKTGQSPEPYYLENLIRKLFPTPENAHVWQSQLTKLVNLCQTHNILTELSTELAKSSQILLSEIVSEASAVTWQQAWRTATVDLAQFQIPLRLLNAAVRYKQQPGDKRVLLELPTEERKIFQQILNLEED
jgi:tetratricopeptide (TPR) repeat protein